MKAYRVQLWKGKENKILKKKIENNNVGANLLIIFNLQIYLGIQKWQVLGGCIT